jgi:hypothetical protein
MYGQITVGLLIIFIIYLIIAGIYLNKGEKLPVYGHVIGGLSLLGILGCMYASNY